MTQAALTAVLLLSFFSNAAHALDNDDIAGLSGLLYQQQKHLQNQSPQEYYQEQVDIQGFQKKMQQRDYVHDQIWRRQQSERRQADLLHSHVSEQQQAHEYRQELSKRLQQQLIQENRFHLFK